VDHYGPLERTAAGHRFILVITDRFTKLVRAIPGLRLDRPGQLGGRLWSDGPAPLGRGVPVH